MTTEAGAVGTRKQGKIVLEYLTPAILPPAVLRHFVWYFLTMVSILFLSTAAAVAAIAGG
jgi:hypothetical protein